MPDSILLYFYWVFLSLVIKLLLAGGVHMPFGSSLYVLRIGNHHLGADKFQHFGTKKRVGGGRGREQIYTS